MATAPYTFSHPSAATYPPPLFHGAPFPYSASTQIHGYTYPPPFPIVPHPSPPPPAFPYAAAYPYPPPASAYASPTGSSPAHDVPPPQTHVPPPPLYCPFPTPMCSTAAAPMASIPPDEAAKNGHRNDPTAPPPRGYATPPLAPSSPPGAGVTPPFPPVQGVPYSSPPPGSTTLSYPSPPGSSTPPVSAAPPPPTSGESSGHTMPPSQGSPPSTGYHPPKCSSPGCLLHPPPPGTPPPRLVAHPLSASTPTSSTALQRTSSGACHHARPDFTYQGRDHAKGNITSSGFFMEDDAVIQAVADKHVPTKDGTHHRLQRELLNIQVRLDQQQARDRTSFDIIQGDLVKLTSMASQLASSIGKHSTLPASGSSPVEVAGTAAVAPKVFGEMSRPNSWHGAHAIAPEYENYGYGYPNQIQSSCVQSGSTNLSEQYLDERPQPYGFHNLDRQSVVLADGTEHSYFTLPADYPLERVVREPVFDVYDDESDGCSNEFVQVFTGSSEQKTYEVPENYPLPQATSRQMCAVYDEKTEGETDESADVFTTTPKQQSHEEERQEGVQDYTLELQQKDDERECNCPVIKASDSSATRSSQLSVEHSMSELRMKWDPGDTRLHVLFTTASNLSPIAEINNPASGSIVMAPIASYELDTDEIEVKVDSGKPILGPERSTDGVFSFTNEEKSVCQTATGHSISIFLWDPGATKFLVQFMTATGVTELHACLHPQFTNSCEIQKLLHSLVTLKKMRHWPYWKLPFSTALKLFLQALCTNTAVRVTKQRHHPEVPVIPQWYTATPSMVTHPGASLPCFSGYKCLSFWIQHFFALWKLEIAASATELQCTDASKPVMVQILVVQFSASIFEATTMCSYTFEGSWTEMNSPAKHVLVVPLSKITPVAKHALFLICQDTHDQEQVTEVNVSAQIFIVVPCSTARLMVMMLLNGHEFLDGQLAYMSHHTRISSAVWVRYPIIVLSCRFPSFEMAKLQWDPGIGMPSSLYLWMQGLTAIATAKSLSGLPIPLLAKWQSKVASASFKWDPGTMSLMYKFKWWLLYTEENTNWNKNIKCYGVALWLIHFQPP